MGIYDDIKPLYPILEGSNFEKIVKIITDTFDYLHELNYKAIYEYYVPTVTNIIKKANERGVPLFDGDTNYDRIDRVYKAYSFLRELTTKKGIEEFIAKYYSKNFEILIVAEIESFALDEDILDGDAFIGASNSAVFILRFFEELSNETKTLLTTILDKVKPAHVGYVIEEIYDVPFFEIGTSLLDANYVIDESLKIPIFKIGISNLNMEVLCE